MDNFDFRTFRTIKRTCFDKVFGTSIYGSKFDVAQRIWDFYRDKAVLKQIFRRILLCSSDNCNDCMLRAGRKIPVNQLNLVHFQGDAKDE